MFLNMNETIHFKKFNNQILDVNNKYAELQVLKPEVNNYIVFLDRIPLKKFINI